MEASKAAGQELWLIYLFLWEIGNFSSLAAVTWINLILPGVRYNLDGIASVKNEITLVMNVLKMTIFRSNRHAPTG